MRPSIEPQGHETQPPSRFTEASLVKRLEELGVGRPSTYASIINRIQDVGYVWKKGMALVPTWTAFALVALMEQHFGDLVDYAFTARMEDDLDAIARGDRDMVPYLSMFYWGTEGPIDVDRLNGSGLKAMVTGPTRARRGRSTRFPSITTPTAYRSWLELAGMGLLSSVVKTAHRSPMMCPPTS